MRIFYVNSETPIGMIMLAATERGVCFIQFADSSEQLLENVFKEYKDAEILPADGSNKEKLAEWVQKIERYLNGKQDFPELPLDIKGSGFRLKVWKYLRSISKGKLLSYKEIAKNIGMPKAIRAVANACANNNIALAIPCHRVVRSDGNISGYRWGIERKKALIELESKAS